MIIPSRFQDRVIRHFIAASVRDAHPLILAIQGPPGSGKSFQLWNALSDARIKPVHNAAVELSGGYEGDSAAALREAVLLAVNDPAKTAIVINDLDLSPAGQSDRSVYTVNSQLLVGALMDLCDQGDSVRRADGYRVPIYVTGNNLELLPRPVTRPSRMDIYTWTPSSEEVTEIVSAMFHDAGFQVDLSSLRTYASDTSWSIARYAAALSELVADRLLAQQQKLGRIDLSAARSLLQTNGAKEKVSLQELSRVLGNMQGPLNHLEEVAK